MDLPIFLFLATLLRGLAFRFAKLDLFTIFQTGMRGFALDRPGYLASLPIYEFCMRSILAQTMKITSMYCEASQCIEEKGVLTYTHQDVYCNIILQGDTLIRSNTREYHEKSTFLAEKTFMKSQGKKKEGKSLK